MGLSGPSGSFIWQETRLPHSRQAAKTKTRNGIGGCFLGPDRILFSRISTSRADLDSGVEKGVRGMVSFITSS